MHAKGNTKMGKLLCCNSAEMYLISQISISDVPRSNDTTHIVDNPIYIYNFTVKLESM